MKNKRLFLPTVITLAAIIAMALSCVVISIAKKPTVTHGEFGFSITYELDGERITINDVYSAHYDRNGGYNDSKSRIYEGKIGGLDEGETRYTVKDDADGRIVILTKLYADYLMGDPEYDYFDDKPFEPRIYYYDEYETEFHDEETLAEHGVKLISFEYPAPIENSLVFSHVSYFSSAIVPPTLLMSLLALIATIFLVRKEKKLLTKWQLFKFIGIV